MKLKHILLLLSFLFLTQSAFSTSAFLAKPIPPNTIVKKYFSQEESKTVFVIKKMTSYPTQIVRMEADLKGPPQSCEAVLRQIEAFFINQINSDNFFYNSILYCTYDPNTNFASHFVINSYFDPLDEDAIAYLKKYLASHNGHNLLGTPFQVEDAQGLVVSLDIDSGILDADDDSKLLRIRHDNASHYFSSNYDMHMKLISDLRKSFYSHDSKLVLPFLDRWFLTSIWTYAHVLSQSNYVELRPELIFLMDKKPKIFSPLLRLDYAHNCSKYENQRCL